LIAWLASFQVIGEAGVEAAYNPLDWLPVSVMVSAQPIMIETEIPEVAETTGFCITQLKRYWTPFPAVRV
jgi:hypothetical protein